MKNQWLYIYPRSKGLEFDHVFIVGVNSGVIPLTVPVDNNDKAQEEHDIRERALLYVHQPEPEKNFI